MFRLCLKIFLCPHLPVQLGIVDEGLAFLCCIFHFSWRQLFLAHPEKSVVFWVVPKDSDTWHLLIKCLHVFHLCIMLAFCQLGHGLQFRVVHLWFRVVLS